MPRILNISRSVYSKIRFVGFFLFSRLCGEYKKCLPFKSKYVRKTLLHIIVTVGLLLMGWEMNLLFIFWLYFILGAFTY